MGTKLNPGAFDCYKNALDDEPMFVLLARDDKAADIVVAWADKYRREKESASKNKRMTVEEYAKYTEALDCADAMQKWHNHWENTKRIERQKRDLAITPAPLPRIPE